MKSEDQKTVRVRIAVVVDERGNYNACGWTDAEDPVRWARDGMERDPQGSRVQLVHFVEADVPVPQRPQTIAISGVVKPASN
ncbi:MAG: hypothetical protein H6713_00495 [Myxococcales bacterium]|nr:hypothetical protein [Myxococcales bacterium]